MSRECRPVIAIVGPTASGKTRRAVDLAKAIGGEIISGDSRQVYRGMNLGTGKDLEEYGDVPYHLIDVADAGTKYNLYGFLRDAAVAADEISRRGNPVILCGGTGLYVESFLKGLSLPEVPENKLLREALRGKTVEELKVILEELKDLHNVTDLDSAQRAVRAIEIQTYYKEHPDAARTVISPEPRQSVVIGIDIEREERRKRITSRLDARLSAGMIEEVERLLASGIAAEDLIYYGLEYKYLTLYVTGAISRVDMRDQLEIAIHQFAKRQMTWFRGMERRGFRINWFPHDMDRDAFVAAAMKLYEIECSK